MSQPKILCVTSFNQKIFDLSGKGMIKSFIETKQLGTMLVCNEGFEYKTEQNNIISYQLDKYEYLNNWIDNNVAFIPTTLGGNADPLKMSYWNKNASRWFRKIASLHYAVKTYGSKYDYLIWIDSDIEFKKSIPMKVHIEALNKNGMFYFYGDTRSKKNYGYETGLLGFNLNNGGIKLLDKCFDLYDSGSYRKYERWDDGYIFRMMNEKKNKKKIKTKDLGISNEHDVLNNESIYHIYLKHNKGIHARAKLFL